MKYDVVFVDWDGTLSGSRFWDGWANDPARQSDNQRIQERFFGTPPNLLEDWMRGVLDAETIVEEVSKRTGLGYVDLLTGLRESCETMEFFDAAVLGIIAQIRKRGTKVVIATDNMDTFTRWTVPALRLGEDFDAILDSHSLGALKRDKESDGRSKFFAAWLDDSGIAASRTALVDDGAHNAVVQDFGMDYLQVTADNSATSILAGLL